MARTPSGFWPGSFNPGNFWPTWFWQGFGLSAFKNNIVFDNTITIVQTFSQDINLEETFDSTITINKVIKTVLQ